MTLERKFVLNFLVLVSSGLLLSCKPAAEDSELNWYKKGAKKAPPGSEGNEWQGTEDDKPYVSQKVEPVTPKAEVESPIDFGKEKTHWTLAGHFSKDGNITKLKQHVTIGTGGFVMSTKKNPVAYEQAEKSLETWWNSKMTNWAAKKKIAKAAKDAQQHIDEYNKLDKDARFKKSLARLGNAWPKMKTAFKTHFWDKEKARVQADLEAKSENGMKAMLSMWYDVYFLEKGFNKTENHTIEMNAEVGVSPAEGSVTKTGAAFQVLIAGMEVYGKEATVALDVNQFIPVPKFLNQKIPIVGMPELADLIGSIEVYPEIKMVGDLDIRKPGAATISIGPKASLVLGFGVQGRLIAGLFQAGAKAAVVPIEGTFPVSVTAGISKSKKFFYGGVTFAGATMKFLSGRLVLVAKVDPPFPFNFLMYPATFIVNNVGTYLTKKEINLNPTATEWELPIWAPEKAYKVVNPAGKWTGPTYVKILAGADCADAKKRMDEHIAAMAKEVTSEKDIDGKAVDKGIQMTLTKVKTQMAAKCTSGSGSSTSPKTPSKK